MALRIILITMRRKKYAEPHVWGVDLSTEQLMIGASPGVGGPYNPGEEIDSKENYFDDDEDGDVLEPTGSSRSRGG